MPMTITQSRRRNTLVIMLVEKASFGSLKGVRINLKGYPSLVFVALNHHAFATHALERSRRLLRPNGVGDDYRGRGGVEREAALVGRRARKDDGLDVVVAETTGASTSTSSSSRFVVVV